MGFWSQTSGSIPALLPRSKDELLNLPVLPVKWDRSSCLTALLGGLGNAHKVMRWKYQVALIIPCRGSQGVLLAPHGGGLASGTPFSKVTGIFALNSQTLKMECLP